MTSSLPTSSASFKQVIINVGPKLVPFFKTLAIYFVVFLPQEQPSIVAMVLKILPIVSLMLFVFLMQKNAVFSRKIMLGLMFSMLGDACLIWKQYFQLGMLCFAIGHINYIRAFGFKPLKIHLGIILYSITIIGTLYLLPGLKQQEDNGLLIGVPIYSLIITTMLWRAIARLNDLKSWPKISTSIGSILFAISDFIIALSMFKFPINHGQLLIMSTYYSGQLGIALSVIDSSSSSSSPTSKAATKKLKN